MDFQTFATLLSPPTDSHHFYGVMIGVVTNNQDPDGLARVKVKLPWLTDDDESHWARIVAPMAGNDRGLYCLPEVDDEVLVAFDHGMIEFPYVLGALWNGKDKPPESNDDGKNNKRTLKSRSGHIIRLDDSDGAEKIEIVDKSGKNSITFDASANTITIQADSDIAIQSSNGKLTLSGKGVEITSQAAVKIEASQGLDLKAGGQMNIKGATVNIN
jgi:uncharacterized protein involved in type VI secretion and phage assembly